MSTRQISLVASLLVIPALLYWLLGPGWGLIIAEMLILALSVLVIQKHTDLSERAAEHIALKQRLEPVSYRVSNLRTQILFPNGEKDPNPTMVTAKPIDYLEKEVTEIQTHLERAAFRAAIDKARNHPKLSPDE